MNMTEHKTLAAALVAAQSCAKSVEKDSTNSFHKYRYASAEAIMAEAREALNASGLATVMERWELLAPTHEGASERVKVYFVTMHAHSEGVLRGDVEYHVIPEKGRPEDKATATALTYAEGYYLRGLLCLPRVDEDSDVDQRDDRDKKPAAKRPANGKSDQAATAREEYKAKIMGLSAKALAEKCASFDDAADKAIAHFGGQQHADDMRTATIERMFKMLDLEIGGLATIPATVEWEAWRTKFADKYLNDAASSVLDAKLERHREHLNYELEHAPA